MKQNYYFQRMLSAVIFLFASVLSWAYDFEAKNADGVTIYYNLINNDMEAEVTYGDDIYSGDIIIPSTVTYDGKTLSVISIGNYSFYFCSDLTSVNIENGVTSIGDEAFRGCSGLTSVYMPESMTNINRYAFCDCSSLTSVNIPKSVTSIGSSAFEGCSSLTSVNIPNSVTSIGSSAFEDCSSLTSVNIPESVTYIDYGAFEGCSSLISITIPNSVRHIGFNVFESCSSLTSVYSLIESPFEIPLDTFYDIADDATLYVPQGTKDMYEATYGWIGHFSNIVEFNATSISEVNPGQSAEGYVVYTLNGTKVNVKGGDLKSLPRGIYIVNGKKTIVK